MVVNKNATFGMKYSTTDDLKQLFDERFDYPVIEYNHFGSTYTCTKGCWTTDCF